MKQQIIEILKHYARPMPAYRLELILFLEYEIRTTARRIREAVHEIKVSGGLPGLVSTRKGYVVADGETSFIEAIKRLDAQIESMKEQRRALCGQWEGMTGQIPVSQDGQISLMAIDEIEPPPYDGADVFKDWREMTDWENRDGKK